LCFGAAAILGIAGCAPFGVRRPEPSVGRIPPFATASPRGGLLADWRPQVPRRDLSRTFYEAVERDGRRVLHAVADDSASGLRCDVDIDPKATPWLEWEWCTRFVDARATVAVDELDDAPARIAVGFDGDFASLTLREQLFGDLVLAVTGYAMPFATLMYVWDGQAPPESIFTYARSSRIRYVVVESGAANVDRWLRYRRNVVEDYRRAFGGAPDRIRDIGVLTDSDDLNTRSESWYGDISLRSASPQP
jgi:hypothetical protein